MNTRTIYTRAQYLNKECTHQEYYGQWTIALERMVSNHIGRERILASECEHFNDIPLRRWDNLAPLVGATIGHDLARANSSKGYSLSDCVCAAKAAAHAIRNSEAQ